MFYTNQFYISTLINTAHDGVQFSIVTILEDIPIHKYIAL